MFSNQANKQRYSDRMSDHNKRPCLVDRKLDCQVPVGKGK
jgi:hypothetical protein